MKLYCGIFFAALYGRLYRLLETIVELNNFYSLSSITFIWIIPIMIALIPNIVAHDHLKDSKLKQFFIQSLSVLIFFIFTMITRLEDLFCILILSIPFITTAGVSSLIIGYFKKIIVF